jgi:MoaA/NifB/PqqE/SkfB family radical SAM enzyme
MKDADIFHDKENLTFAAEDALLSNLDSEFPLVINVEPTNRCNLRCSFCFYKTYKPVQGDLDEELARNIAREIVTDNRFVQLLVLHKDGEPLLYNNLGWLIHLFKSTKRIGAVHLNTNATLLDESKGRELITSGLDSITFSIDAAYRKTFKRIKGVDKLPLVNLNVSQFSRKARYVGSPKTRAKIMRLSDITEREIKQFYAYWESKVDFVQDHYVHDWSGEADVDVESPKKERYTCPLPWYIAVISWDGEVSFCSFDYNKTAVVGKLDYNKGITLHKLWVSRTARRARMALLKHNWGYMGICKNCISWTHAPNIEKDLELLKEFI